MSKFLEYFNRIYEQRYKKRPLVLTKKQRDLLLLLAQGLTLKEIALQAGKTYNNMKKRTQCLYKKFQVKNRYELIRKAIGEKLLTTKEVKPKFRKRFIPKEKPLVISPIGSEYLTVREITYLKLAGAGKTDSEIIKLMGLYGTYPIWEIKRSIKGYLNCKNITQAIYIAKTLEII